MSLQFNTLLNQADIAPAAVRLLRHQDSRSTKGRTPYELWRDDRPAFESYQAIQSFNNRSKLRSNYWASFVVTPSRETLFAGLPTPPGLPIVVEVETEAQLEEALAAGVTHILADNQSPERVAAWVRRAGPGVTIQASGGIVAETAAAYARAGAQLISIGALTHSVSAASINFAIGGWPTGSPVRWRIGSRVWAPWLAP